MPWFAAFGIMLGFIVVGLAVAVARAERDRARLRATRAPGLAAFAASLGRSEHDPIVEAVFNGIVSEAGDELACVQADDELSGFWGIAGTDLDDVVRACLTRLPPGWRADLSGHYGIAETPRRLVAFLDTNVLRPESK